MESFLEMQHFKAKFCFREFRTETDRSKMLRGDHPRREIPVSPSSSLTSSSISISPACHRRWSYDLYPEMRIDHSDICSSIDSGIHFNFHLREIPISLEAERIIILQTMIDRWILMARKLKQEFGILLGFTA